MVLQRGQQLRIVAQHQVLGVFAALIRYGGLGRVVVRAAVRLWLPVCEPLDVHLLCGTSTDVRARANVGVTAVGSIRIRIVQPRVRRWVAPRHRARAPPSDCVGKAIQIATHHERAAVGRNDCLAQMLSHAHRRDVPPWDVVACLVQQLIQFGVVGEKLEVPEDDLLLILDIVNRKVDVGHGFHWVLAAIPRRSFLALDLGVILALDLLVLHFLQLL